MSKLVTRVQRPTLDRLRELAESYGGECLSDRYVNLDSVMRWACKRGHVWETLARKVWTGVWCPKCLQARFKYSIADMRKLAKKGGGDCLSEQYLGSAVKLRWRCDKDHVWEAVPQSVLAGTWCPYCRGLNKTIEDMRAVANERGGHCLSNAYVNSLTKLRWRCAKNHVWEARPDDVVRGHWCPYCVGMHKTIRDMRALAKERGGHCLSNEYVSAHTKLRWRCNKNHVWEAKPNDVRNGSWCPNCRGSHSQRYDVLVDGAVPKLMTRAQRPTLGRLRELAESYGGECLSDRYLNLESEMRWRCKQGHVWEILARKVWTGVWCPKCPHGRFKYSIADMRKLAKQRGGDCLSDQYLGNTVKLLWRCSEGHEWKAQPAGLLNSGSWCPYCVGRHKTIRDMRALAKERGGQCLSNEYVSAHTKLRWRCNKEHVWQAMPAIVVRGSWCPYCRGRNRTIRDMRALAKERGGRCLSTEYVNTDTKLRWQCAKNHVWEARPSALRKGSWCPNCRGRNKTIRDMRALAKERRGQCLSNEYVNGATKLRWQCVNDHVWEAKPQDVLVGNWCPYCISRHKTIDDMRALAKERGGRCLSTEYVNRLTTLRWRCANGHVWEARPKTVRSGRWCPICGRVRNKLVASRTEDASEGQPPR